MIGWDAKKIYRFTPTFTGTHVLFAPPPASPINNNVYYSYKTLAAGCTSSGWTCIGARNYNIVTQLSFGPLTAGTTYIIMVSPNNTSAAITGDFRIECPNCTYHTVTSDITDRTPTTVTLHSNHTGGYVEYGPYGFIPGSDGTPGTNGTLVPIVSSEKIVTGLTPATSYDFYVRSFCSGAGWSANSMRVNNGTNPCPQIINYGSLNSTSSFNAGSLHGYFGNYEVCPAQSIGYGDEAIVKFTAPATAVYDVKIDDFVTNTLTGTGTFVNFASRLTNNTCVPIGFNCQIPFNIVHPSYYYTINATSGLIYDILLDAVDSFSTGSANITISCAAPGNISATNVTSTGAVINFTHANSTYIEYGPVGFTPGTGATAGGGTLLSNVTSPVSLSSLLSFTNYVAYIRSKCGNDFSTNQQVLFKTLHNCGNEPLLTCGTNFNVNMFNSTGQWTGYNCGTGSTNSTEFLYRFAPTQTGLYTITNSSSIGFGSSALNVYYKTVGGSCDVNGWTCIGTLTSSPQTINLAALTAGTTYLILFDGLYANCTKTLRIDCFAPCAATITGSPTFCAGSANTLTANTGSGITYQWYRNGVLQAGAATSTFNANSNGTYYVVESSSCGTSQSNSIVVTQINNPNATISYTTPLSFCAPGNVVLTSSSFSGVSYQWQKNSVDIAGATLQNFTANTNGSYRVKQTGSGCVKYSSAVSVTTATSVIAAITANGPVTFCSGGSVVLSVSNAVPGYGYQWKKNNVNITNATQSSYTATAAGSYTCLVTANCGNATSNAIVVSTGGITASVVPSGTVTICTGATALLSANTGSGYAFQWKKNGTNITGATTSTYNATTAGAYTVAITSPCGNATSVATTVSIGNVTASISPSGSATICAGSAQTFTANTGYNFVYQWFRNGVALAGATSSTYATSNYGSYTVRVTQGGVCSATSAASVLSVTNNPTPTVTPQGPTTFCAGQSVVLSANTYSGVQQQWQKNGIDIAGATNQNYTATTAGSYRVKQTANGCTKSSATVTVTVNCRETGVGMAEKEESNLRVMPNPFTDELILSGLELKGGDRVELVDVLGKTVLSYNIDLSTQNLKLKTQNIKPGLYFLLAGNSSNKSAIKIIKL
ncbi:MAG: T9SS type A sorting domain-containing protein [Bacteroidetes bacterium]|nr:T9SS type A sorting domain-containing protein [Bacteroidota bacterium]